MNLESEPETCLEKIQDMEKIQEMKKIQEMETIMELDLETLPEKFKEILW